MKNMMMMNSQQQLQQQQLQQQYRQHQHQHQHQQQQQQQQRVDGHSSPHWTAKETDDDIKEDQRRPGVLHLSARGLNIVWGNDKRFWQWISHNQEQEEQKQESHYYHFDYSAELLQVNWIEVSRKLSFNNSKLCPLVAYEIYYVVKFKADAFGWHSIPIKFKVKQTNGSSNSLETEGTTSKESEISEILENYRKSHDVWQCIYGGQFTVPADRQGFVEFGMFEVDSDWWKGSMVLQGVKFEPKRCMTEPNNLNVEA